MMETISVETNNNYCREDAEKYYDLLHHESETELRLYNNKHNPPARNFFVHSKDEFLSTIEDNIDGGWVYAVSGTGIGILQVITAADGSTITTKTATGWDSTTTLIKILPQWHTLVKLNSAATMIGTDAAAGSGLITILENWVEADSIGLAPLDATLHSGLTGLNNRNVKFYADIIFRNHVLNPND